MSTRDIQDAMVIDDAMIRECIARPKTVPGTEKNEEEEQKRLEKNRQLAAHELRTVECLIFSYQNIRDISNLDCLDGLAKLQLDNNVINKIENLDHLINLTWLDLSFNNIEKIEGLETLTKLEVLSLAHNQISVLENMDQLVSLECLTIGSNRLKDLDNLMYLRRFKKLRMLGIAKNPVCEDPDWKNFVLAYIPRIQYLDFRLVDKTDIQAAKEQYHDDLLRKEELETEQEEEEKLGVKAAEHRELLKAANLGGVDGLYLHMFTDDSDWAKLIVLSYLRQEYQGYQNVFEQRTDQFKQEILEHSAMKEKERVQFEEVMKQAREENESAAVKLIEEFENENKTVLRELRAGGDISDQRLKELRLQNDKLRDDLMELEIQLVEGFEDAVRKFERIMGDIAEINRDAIARYYRALREAETEFHDSITMLVMQDWDKFSRQAIDREISEDERTMLIDKEGLVNVLNGSHDTRTGKIDIAEEDMTSKEQKQLDQTITGVHDAETSRDRGRVSEIWVLWSRVKSELDAYVDEADV